MMSIPYSVNSLYLSTLPAQIAPARRSGLIGIARKVMFPDMP